MFGKLKILLCFARKYTQNIHLKKNGGNGGGAQLGYLGGTFALEIPPVRFQTQTFLVRLRGPWLRFTLAEGEFTVLGEVLSGSGPGG